MQIITRCLNRYKIFKLNKFLRRSLDSGNPIITHKNARIWSPIATSLLNQRKLIIRSDSYSINNYTASNVEEFQLVDPVKFEKVCEETLESLSEYFEELIENANHLKSADVNYSSGVLTVNFGDPYGTYVINRQSPNKQIWLSSPTSGPKRYDFNTNGEYWLYKHDGRTLHQLLQTEIGKIVGQEVDFTKCLYSRLI